MSQCGKCGKAIWQSVNEKDKCIEGFCGATSKGGAVIRIRYNHRSSSEYCTIVVGHVIGYPQEARMLSCSDFTYSTVAEDGNMHRLKRLKSLHIS